MAYEKEQRIAINAVAKACRLCKDVQSELVTENSLDKKNRSPVTVADYGSQTVIIHDILTAFPNDRVVAEEDSEELRQSKNINIKERVIYHVNKIISDLSEQQILETIDYGAYDGVTVGRFWTLDPIDGTKGFLRKDQYAVALALIENGHVVLGVLGCPNLPWNIRQSESPRGVLFVSVNGGGTMMSTLGDSDWQKITVGNIFDPRHASFCESFESGHSSHDYSARVANFLGIKKPPLRMDSQCKYALVARGDASIYLRFAQGKGYKEKIWDHAAGAIIVEEAGGKVTDAHGKPLDFTQGRTLSNNYGIVVSNGKLHEQILAAIQENI